MAVRLNIGKCSLLGNYRENNEDNVSVREQDGVTMCIVADGMGGQQAGEKASLMATEIIPREVAAQLAEATSADDIRRIVRKSIVQANEEIISMGQLDSDFRNMGTTVVGIVWHPSFRDDALFVAGIGDSRAYLIRDDKIEQLTTDHSLAQALVEAKTISVEEAREHKFKNVLWKYLGSKEVGDGPEVKMVFIRPGDRLLLCTDGVTGVVPDEKIAEAIALHTDMQACSEALCQLSLDMGSRDNVSAIVVEIAGEE
ncbi:MAG TPA: protein phosphatase 2C domain-containing protein [Gemmatales bacterium]|nr:protein phosphatase 2C domain-containing protein [Gemmatales bacterium]HMP58667.1 protein phosphatase 2C domain-containing protein [Gemmatales bacterium]